MPYTFELCMMEKQKEKRNKQNIIEIFAFDFLDSEED